MRLLVLECSSPKGSVAVLDDGQVCAEAVWSEDFRNRQALFNGIRQVQQDCGFSWNSIDALVVGRGPGAFSGMRIAFSVAQALALPDGLPVLAFNSAASMALCAARQRAAQQVAVVGDARRQQLWMGLFALDGEIPQLINPFALYTPCELACVIPPEAVLASSELERVVPLFPATLSPDRCVAGFPSAAHLGRLAALALARGDAPEPLEPLYLHPAVFVEPRFPS